jgi:hypothetical protein
MYHRPRIKRCWGSTSSSLVKLRVGFLRYNSSVQIPRLRKDCFKWGSLKVINYGFSPRLMKIRGLVISKHCFVKSSYYNKVLR